MNQRDRREAGRVPAGNDGGRITCSEPVSCLLPMGTEPGLWDLMLRDKSPFASCAMGVGNVREERGRPGRTWEEEEKETKMSVW